MLYIVSTPIGNLDDISLRQAKTLSNSEIILAEDTRSAGTLMQKIQNAFHFPLHPEQRFVSYYKEKEFQKLPEIIQWLEEDKIVSLISESGSPLISDPGSLLLKTVIKKDLSFTVVPGAAAIITALQYSGFNTNEFLFLGFLPKKQSEIIRLINQLKQIKAIIPKISYIFYESPHRIKETLQLLANELSEGDICICRELTKKYEEIRRGKPQELLQYDYKGEITVIIS